MAGRFFLLHRVTDFAPGYFENTAVEAGCIQLGRRAGAYVDSGTYTSPTFVAEGFFGLIPSWNADTPRGTSVEVEARVASEGHWSRWFSFGFWSPYIDRASVPPHHDEIARVEGEMLSLEDGIPAADRVQLRVSLHTNNPQKSPRVRLLAASTNATYQMRQNEPAYDRLLEMPAYAAQNRDPSMAPHMGSVTSLCMMMNRYGRDLLPEEVARSAYDSGAGHYGNMAFLSAVAGMHGFSSYVSYTGIPALRREVWLGRAVGARVHYRAPALSQDAEPDENIHPLPPVLEGAVRGSTGHVVAVHGFLKRDGAEYVVVNDPNAPDDAAVQQYIPLATFAKMYTGLSIFLQPGSSSAGQNRPRRKLATLSLEDGCLQLWDASRNLVPDELAQLAPCTLCYTLSDGTVYASSAQRKFYYLMPDEKNRVALDMPPAPYNRLVLYLIGSRGDIWVAEKHFEDA